MALSILTGLLQDYVQSLFDEGIVNDQFSQVLTLKTEDEPDSVLKLINAYLNDAEAILSEFPENMYSWNLFWIFLTLTSKDLLLKPVKYQRSACGNVAI
ncbi:hypothetical protein CRG98_025901 [Punica granatum]|uniref:Uncharacterized protein n=1 Tax=Punica granatum TaxID=22663 RepID=A0A2I0JCJ3_PUNGR|nr:hypothetical protein CRG98_025901 [Punica granatum]